MNASPELQTLHRHETIRTRGMLSILFRQADRHEQAPEEEKPANEDELEALDEFMAQAAQLAVIIAQQTPHEEIDQIGQYWTLISLRAQLTINLLEAALPRWTGAPYIADAIIEIDRTAQTVLRTASREAAKHAVRQQSGAPQHRTRLMVKRNLPHH